MLAEAAIDRKNTAAMAADLTKSTALLAKVRAEGDEICRAHQMRASGLSIEEVNNDDDDNDDAQQDPGDVLSIYSKRADLYPADDAQTPTDVAPNFIQLTAHAYIAYLLPNHPKDNDKELVVCLRRWPRAILGRRDPIFFSLLVEQAQILLEIIANVGAHMEWSSFVPLFRNATLNLHEIASYVQNNARATIAVCAETLFGTFLEKLVNVFRVARRDGIDALAFKQARVGVRRYALAMEKLILGSASALDSEKLSVVLFEPDQKSSSIGAQLTLAIHGENGTGKNIDLTVVRLHGFHQTQAVREAVDALYNAKKQPVVVVAVGIRPVSTVMKYLSEFHGPRAAGPVAGAVFYQSFAVYDDETRGATLEKLFHSLVDRSIVGFEHYTGEIKYENLRYSAPYLVLDTQQANIDKVREMVDRGASLSDDEITFKLIPPSPAELAGQIELFVQQREYEHFF